MYGHVRRRIKHSEKNVCKDFTLFWASQNLCWIYVKQDLRESEQTPEDDSSWYIPPPWFYKLAKSDKIWVVFNIWYWPNKSNHLCNISILARKSGFHSIFWINDLPRKNTSWKKSFVCFFGGTKAALKSIYLNWICVSMSLVVPPFYHAVTMHSSMQQLIMKSSLVYSFIHQSSRCCVKTTLVGKRRLLRVLAISGLSGFWKDWIASTFQDVTSFKNLVK